MATELLTAADVARGVCRLFAQQGLVAIPEGKQRREPLGQSGDFAMYGRSCVLSRVAGPQVATDGHHCANDVTVNGSSGGCHA